jgi:uridylate kinase
LNSKSDTPRRLLLKVSGEGFSRDGETGLDTERVQILAAQLRQLTSKGVQVACVIGGGNILRGNQSEALGIARATADYMGMLATVINGLALSDALEANDVPTRVMSAIDVHKVCEPFIRRRAIRHLEKGRVVIFAGGTGNPYFTTDTAASLRAMEIGAEVIFKATKVDGIYTADPMVDESATKFQELSYLDVLNKGLKVMDSTSISLCMDNKLPLVIFNVRNKHSIKRVLMGEKLGTTVGI